MPANRHLDSVAEAHGRAVLQAVARIEQEPEFSMRTPTELSDPGERAELKHQYSSGSRNVVAERSASLMIQIRCPRVARRRRGTGETQFFGKVLRIDATAMPLKFQTQRV